MDEALTSSCVCNISAQTQRAELIRQSNLIIWDELPMTHRYCVEALDRTLRDLTKHNQPFGGKTILFSGDWRQTGPIVKNGSPTDTVDAALYLQSTLEQCYPIQTYYVAARQGGPSIRFFRSISW